MSNTPEQTRLPKLLDPRKFAQKGIELEGQIPLREMPRVAELVLNQDASVAVKLHFSVDEQRFKLITGTVSAQLQLPCQRCLEPAPVSLESSVNLAVAWDEDEAKNFPKRFDPLIHGEGQTDIYVVIEDEILLNLPMVVYHDHDCIGKTSFGDEEADSGLEEEKNPFQILEQLKGSPKS